MDELDDIRKKRLAQLQDQLDSQMDEEADVQRQIGQIESVVKAHLSREAAERYSNIKLAHPERAVQLLAVIMRLIQMGKIKGVISDEELKQVLQQITPEKREFKFRRM